jgi:hypothetical protein
MSFLFPTLLWAGLPLVALPLVIHLLNPQRQRRIRWAAMQFLLESQRRSRNWVLLRQFLLLAARTAAIGLVVLLLAGLVLQNSWARIFGTGETHHVVLVDDSFSMSDQWDDSSALDRARQVVRVLVEQMHRQPDVRRVTILTFSEAAALAAGAEPAVYRQSVDDRLRTQIESIVGRISVSETAVQLGDALRGTARLPKLVESESQVLHVLSDFRARHFDEATDVRDMLLELQEEFDQTHLVQCVREERSNLSITSLAPSSSLRAAGVESWMNVTVANYGRQPANGVTLRLEQDGTQLPVIVLPEIPPREEITHRFRIRFHGVGPHRLAAALDVDAVDVDNHRYFASELGAGVPVLVVDGSPGSRDGFFFAKALAPGGQTRTGWQPRIERPEFLRDADDLVSYAAVILLDVDILDRAAIERLESYVSAGGGAAFFLGERSTSQFYNEDLYRDGDGLFPVPLKLPTQLLDGHGEQQVDVVVTAHDLMRALAGERNSFLPLLFVNFYYTTADDWSPTLENGVHVLATLRNGAPLVVEQAFGDGRVVAHLTKLSPTETSLGSWSNWSLNPMFPVLANELCEYLAARPTDKHLRQVGDQLTVAVDENTHAPEFRFLVPDRSVAAKEVLVTAQRVDGTLTAHWEDTTLSGVYEVHVPTVNGDFQTRVFAVNVDAAEGDLALVSPAEIERLLDGARFEFQFADELGDPDQRVAGFGMSGPLLAAVVVLLLLEQVLGCAASYHAPLLKGRGL